MIEVEFFRWWMPNKNPRGRPYLTRHHMNRADAAAAGAIAPDLSSRVVRKKAETPEELREILQETDTSAIARGRP